VCTVSGGGRASTLRWAATCAAQLGNIRNATATPPHRFNPQDSRASVMSARANPGMLLGETPFVK
jgi:hypothetical protein